MQSESTVLLPNTLLAINLPHFKTTFVKELSTVNKNLLPLQRALSHSSYLSNEPFQVIYMSHQLTADELLIKTTIFFTGIIAGCSCTDDPTPQDTQTEACELLVIVNRDTAQTTFTLIDDL